MTQRKLLLQYTLRNTLLLAYPRRTLYKNKGVQRNLKGLEGSGQICSPSDVPGQNKQTKGLSLNSFDEFFMQQNFSRWDCFRLSWEEASFNTWHFRELNAVFFIFIFFKSWVKTACLVYSFWWTFSSSSTVFQCSLKSCDVQWEGSLLLALNASSAFSLQNCRALLSIWTKGRFLIIMTISMFKLILKKKIKHTFCISH